MIDRPRAKAQETTASANADIPYSSGSIASRRAFMVSSIAALFGASQAQASENYPRSERYPYSFSPLEFLAEQEQLMLPKKTNRKALHTAFTIANAVADHAADMTRIRLQDALLRKYGSSAPLPSTKEALGRASRRQHLLENYVEDIGNAIRVAGYRYQAADFLSSAFADGQIETPFHLDCDLLTHLTLHVAAEHNMPLAAVPAPHHMYIGSFRFPQFAMEMTNIGRGHLATTHREQRKHNEEEGIRSRDPQDYRPCDDEYLKADIIRCLEFAAPQNVTHI
ncbi:MAG TPA: hypothetical protein VHA78_01700 [Candidatus Peribacteraceae bacterium]|nr:hypothetical protein [Candidatus Peribacteraceae bacterium]